MRVRQPGFALIAVILSVAAVFSVTVYGALVLRANLTETGAIATRARDSVAAHAAAALVVKGLVSLPADADTPEPDQLDSMGGLAGSAAGLPQGGTGDAAAAPEFPAFLEALLGEVGEQIQAQTRASGVGAGGDRVATDALASGLTENLPAAELLRVVGLPVRPVVVTTSGVTSRVSLIDTLGKLDINTADQQLLTAYFETLDLPGLDDEALVNQILDWIDTDPVPRRDSLEAPGYAAIGLTPTNGPLRYLDELRFLPAMTPQAMDNLSRDFAVGSSGKLYVPSASEAALSAVGLTDRQIQQIANLKRSGELDARTLRLIVDIESPRWSDRLSLEPSPLVNVTVEVFPAAASESAALSQPPSSIFEGIAYISREGLQDLALRPKLN